MSNTKFHDMEEIQYNDLYKENDVPLENIRPKTLSLALKVGIIIFIGFVGFASFIKFPNEIRLPCELKNQVNEKIYQFNHPCFITQKFIQESSTVNKGDTIIKVSSPELSQIINEHKAIQNSLENHFAHDSIILNTHLNINQNTISQLNMEIYSIQTSINSLKKTAKNQNETNKKLHQKAENDEARFQDLYNTGAISLMEYEEKKQQTIKVFNQYLRDVENQKVRLISLNKRINSLQTEIVKYHSENLKLKTDYNSITHQLKLKIENLESKIKTNYGSYRLSDDGIFLISDNSSIL